MPDSNVAAIGTLSTDGIRRLDFPGPALEAELAACKGTNRTDFNRISTKVGIKSPTEERANFRLRSTIYQSQL